MNWKLDIRNQKFPITNAKLSLVFPLVSFTIHLDDILLKKSISGDIEK